MKADKRSVPICGDFKQTVNKASPLDKYPIPKIEDLFSKLAGGQKFTKLDMSQAYQQLCLEEESTKYVIVNTANGYSNIRGYHLTFHPPQQFSNKLWKGYYKAYLVL